MGPSGIIHDVKELRSVMARYVFLISPNVLNNSLGMYKPATEDVESAMIAAFEKIGFGSLVT